MAAPCDGQLADPARQSCRTRARAALGDSLIAAILVEDLAVTPSPVRTADDVFVRLRWKTVLLPKAMLDLIPSRARLVRRHGWSEHIVVREEWHAYRLGELAHVENALAGEQRERRVTRATESEASQTSDIESSAVEENSTDSTDRFQLTDHASRDSALAVQADGQVDVSTHYPSVKVDASVGGSFDYSKSEAREVATELAKETVARAAKRVESRTRTSRTTRSLTRFEELNRHLIDNTAPEADNRIAIYRWVDKVQRLQAFTYPHRFLLEVQVPEPAAFVRCAAPAWSTTG